MNRLLNLLGGTVTNKNERIEQALTEASKRLFDRIGLNILEDRINSCAALLIYINAMVELTAAVPTEQEVIMADIEYILLELNSWNVGEFIADNYASLYQIVLRLRVMFIGKRNDIIKGTNTK